MNPSPRPQVAEGAGLWNGRSEEGYGKGMVSRLLCGGILGPEAREWVGLAHKPTKPEVTSPYGGGGCTPFSRPLCFAMLQVEEDVEDQAASTACG